MKTYSIALDLLLQSPLHITAIEPGRYMRDTATLKRGVDDEAFGLPCQLTRMMLIARQVPKVVKGEGGDYVIQNLDVPTIPANTLGGRLRRKAAALIAESLIARDLSLSVRAFNTLCAGTADASMKKADTTIAMVNAACADAYLGVFGGTSFALPRGLRIYEGLPVIDETLPLLSIAPQTATVYGSDRLTGVVHFTKKDDVLELRNPQLLEQAIGLAPVAEYIESIMKTRGDKKSRKASSDEDTGKKTELTTSACMEVVRPGICYALRFQLQSHAADQLGLLLLCLQRFANEGQIGGKAASGYGMFSVSSARLFEHDGFARHESGIEIWHRAPTSEYRFTDHPSVVKAVQAGQDYVDGIEPTLIEAFASGDVRAFTSVAARP